MHFGRRLTLLIGANGSGKTSIFDGIAIIIADSGMCTGGQIIVHLRKGFVEERNSTKNLNLKSLNCYNGFLNQ